MENNEHLIPIPGRLHSVAAEGHVAGADEIYDDARQKNQETINSELIEAIGTGGSVDSRIASAVATETSRAQEAESNRYTKCETYTKEEVNNLITTPNQEYVSVIATSETTSATDILPATGAANTIYRVGSWDGTQHNDSVFSEYAWTGSEYIKLSTKSQIVEVYDISANHDGTKYVDLTAALGANGVNIPQSLRKGGMSIKFIQSSDNKYVQYRYMETDANTSATFINTNNWSFCGDDKHIDNQEWIRVYTDSEGRILFGIKTDGSIHWGIGVPKPIKYYIEEKLAEKVDIEEGKSLILKRYAEAINSDEWIYVMTDAEDRVIFGIKNDGTPYTAKIDDRIKNLINENRESGTYNSVINPIRKYENLVGSSLLHNHIGVNVHVNTYNQKKIFDKLCQSAMDAGVRMFRSIGNNADSAYICVQNNVPVWTMDADSPSSVFEKDGNGNYVLDGSGNYIETADFTTYISRITDIITKFNGETDITLSDGNVVNILADYFECCNEWYFNENITTLEVFYTYKKIYGIIKEVSPKTKFVIGSQSTTQYTTDLFNYIDEDGTRFVDVFDVYNYHYYSEPVVDSDLSGTYINSKASLHYEGLRTNLGDKEIWVTETGKTYIGISYDAQAIDLLKRYLLSFSYGIDVVTYYEYMADEDSKNTYILSENYFGLIHRAIHNSYATIYKYDTSLGKSIYGGNPTRFYLASSQWFGTAAVKPANLVIVSIESSTLLDSLKNNGFAVSGNGFTVDKACIVNPVNGSIYNYFTYRNSKYAEGDLYATIDLSDSNNWSGTKNISDEGIDFFKLEPAALSNLNDFIREGSPITDRRNHVFVLLYMNNIDNTTFDYNDQSTWNDWKFEPLPAYNSLKLLGNLLDEGSTKPVRIYDSYVYIFYWFDSKGKTVWSLFTTGETYQIDINFEDRSKGLILDYLGNVVGGISDTISVGASPIFIVNAIGKLYYTIH